MARGFTALYENEGEYWIRTSQVTRLTLLIREPTSIFAYWEIDDSRKKIICEHFKSNWDSLPLYIRLHDVSDIIFDGNNAHTTRTASVDSSINNWYFNNVQPGRHYLADISTKTAGNSYFTLLRSNTVEAPPKYINSHTETNIRFSKPAFLEEVKHSSFAKVQFSLPSSWRNQFTGYNLAEGKRGGGK